MKGNELIKKADAEEGAQLYQMSISSNDPGLSEEIT